MENNNQDIQDRTLDFAVRVVRLCQFLEGQGGVERTLSRQLLRSGTSIGANVREARSAQSDRDFLHKLEIALKEARETEYWLILLVKTELVKPERINLLINESHELIKILVSITKKLKKRIQNH